MQKTGLVEASEIRKDSSIQFMDMVLFAVKSVIIRAPLAFSYLRKEDVRGLEGSVNALYGCVFPFLNDTTIEEGNKIKDKLNPESLKVYEEEGKEKRLAYVKGLMEWYQWCMKQLRWLGALPETSGIDITPESVEVKGYEASLTASH